MKGAPAVVCGRPGLMLSCRGRSCACLRAPQNSFAVHIQIPQMIPIQSSFIGIPSLNVLLLVVFHIGWRRNPCPLMTYTFVDPELREGVMSANYAAIPSDLVGSAGGRVGPGRSLGLGAQRIRRSVPRGDPRVHRGDHSRPGRRRRPDAEVLRDGHPLRTPAHARRAKARTVPAVSQAGDSEFSRR
jgi:hypothetical protein